MNLERGLLIVDDELNILSSLKRLFRQDNYTIFTSQSGEEGLEILKNENIAVIISDQRMPGMSGATFLDKSRYIKPDTMRIILSGFSEAQFLVDAINFGAAWRFLFKPWNDNYLREYVKDAFKIYDADKVNRILQDQLKDSNVEMARLNDLLFSFFEKTQADTKNELVRIKNRWENLPCTALEIDAFGKIIAINKPSETFQVGKIKFENLMTDGVINHAKLMQYKPYRVNLWQEGDIKTAILLLF